MGARLGLAGPVGVVEAFNMCGGRTLKPACWAKAVEQACSRAKRRLTDCESMTYYYERT